LLRLKTRDVDGAARGAQRKLLKQVKSSGKTGFRQANRNENDFAYNAAGEAA
jgi:ribosomal protein S11